MTIVPEERYIKVYEQGVDFLKRMTPPKIELEKYYLGDQRNNNSLDDIFKRFIHSAQNYQSMPNVIAFSKRKKEVEKILCGFDHIKVSKMNPEDLYKRFREEFNITSADSKQNSWHKWSCAIVDSAKFLMEFDSIEDFDAFVDRFSYNVHTSMALPLLISHKINGIGFALACDLLKELGYTRYPKPDVHLMDIFYSLGLSENNQISTFESIIKMSKCCERIDPSVTPYKVDKVFWLICSGKFYLEKPEGIQVKSRKNEFIEMMLEKL